MLDDPYYNESIVHPGCTHFRLRINKNVVGYLQIRTNNAHYYSKDNFWWRNYEIEHQYKDRSTEMFDVNRQMIFEHDLIKLRKTNENDYTKSGIITWNNTKQKLVVNYIEEDAIVNLKKLPAEAPFRDDLKVTAQIFPPNE